MRPFNFIKAELDRKEAEHKEASDEVKATKTLRRVRVVHGQFVHSVCEL